eukprot:2813321-Prymnesium_polylepis.2
MITKRQSCSGDKSCGLGDGMLHRFTIGPVEVCGHSGSGIPLPLGEVQVPRRPAGPWRIARVPRAARRSVA